MIKMKALCQIKSFIQVGRYGPLPMGTYRN